MYPIVDMYIYRGLRWVKTIKYGEPFIDKNKLNLET